MRPHTVWNILWNLTLITAGSVLCAVAINGILIPQQFLAGGIGGLAIFIYYLAPVLPVGVLYFLLNIPLFVLGWVYVGRRFFIYSLVGMTIFSVLVLVPVPTLPVKDPMLSALAAGILSGIGSGIILKSVGSAGGLDILSVILLKRASIRVGTTVMGFNVALLLAGLFRLNVEIILYTMVYMFVTSQLINLVVTGLNQRKMVMVVSRSSEAIAQEIMQSLQRGVTIVDGEGGFTGQRLRILYSVVTFQELSRFKEMIRHHDPAAFMVVTETLEVMGKGIGNQPHW
ncbi:MAG: YitT family protein [Desulfobacterales bacterium]|nr:YitT family protein [Desulfobacterales bacterium]